jgi:uncharacterized protein YjbI with pentapeptide repeats
MPKNLATAQESNLTESIFLELSLMRANLTEANLTRSDFLKAMLLETNLWDATVLDAQNLNRVDVTTKLIVLSPGSTLIYQYRNY